MKLAITAAAACTALLFSTLTSLPSRAADVDNYRWTPQRSTVCRVVETHATNRWGTDVTTRRRVCE